MNPKKQRQKGHLALPQHIPCNVKKTRSIATSNLVLQAAYMHQENDATKRQQSPEQRREKRAGHHHFPGVFFFSAALSAAACVKRLSLANVACLQC
jgi:hypothetical protein